MKPFDLEAALRGEPVVTRGGMKAYITHDNRDTAHKLGIEISPEYVISGFSYRDTNGKYDAVTWTLHGTTWTGDAKHMDDIVGMWEDPTTITIGGVEVTAPYITAPPTDTAYYTPNIGYADNYCDAVRWHRWCETPDDMRRLKLGLVFKTQEDARAYHKAMSRHLTELMTAQKEQQNEH